MPKRARGLRYSLRPIPRLLGRRLGRGFKPLQDALHEGEQEFLRPLAEGLLSGKKVAFALGEIRYELAPDEVEVQLRRDVPVGFSYAEEGGDFALLDTRISEELAAGGHGSRICAARPALTTGGRLPNRRTHCHPLTPVARN